MPTLAELLQPQQATAARFIQSALSPGMAAVASATSPPDDYASDLRRRTSELNKEIARFRAKESAASKHERLRKAAEQLENEVAKLKRVRQASFALSKGAAT